ncbi:MAG TPA: hypothetical protein VI756_02420 [Blastocatellia bacterium]
MSSNPGDFNSFEFDQGEFGGTAAGAPNASTVAASLDLNFFICRFIGSFPPNYTQNTNPRYSNPGSPTGTYLNFWQRWFTPHATDLFNKYVVYQGLYSYFYPNTTPLTWLQWLIVEWWGWRLIPVNYPIARQRQLLGDLWFHYQQRNTPIGISNILAEFGVHAEVTDEPLYYHGYYSQPGIENPLTCYVKVLYSDSWDSGTDSFYDEYYDGGAYAYDAVQIVDEDFIMQLINWERVAGVNIIVEFETFQAPPVRYLEPLGVQGLTN